MVMVDEHREGETQSAESKIRPTMKLRSSLGAKKTPKKTKNHTNKSTGACLLRHFVFGSHQSKAPLWMH